MGAQSGLKPTDVLSLNLGQVLASVDGYQDHLLDLRILSIQEGWYAAYFQSKKPKSLKEILTTVWNEHMSARLGIKQTHSDDINVDKFLELEQRFTSAYKG